MPGPPPKPTAKLKLSGSWRAKYARGDEPEPESGAPRKPEWLDARAGAVWDELVAVLEGMGVLSVADGAILSRYCELWIDWREANEWIRKNGTSYPLRDKSGGVKCFMQFPQVGVRNHIGAELRRIECEFGLTPSARTRIDVGSAGGSSKGGGSSASRFFSAG